ncbi:MAG: ATP-binding protein, partial [Gammaproteobacteria bacterium]|nr:ATP-binding protein [Gammaproteobacteria bacterium]
METKIVRSHINTVALVAALALALLGLALLSAVSRSSADFGDLYRAILIVNIAGATFLLVLIGANVVRMVRDYRRRAPGARLKARLVTAFVALVIVPMAVVYAYAVQFLNEGIDSWFDVQVEQGLGDALELSRTALDVRMRDNLQQTRRLVDRLYSVNDGDMFRILSALRTQTGAQDLTLFAGASRIIATSSANPVDQLPLLPTDEVLLSIRRDGYYVGLEPRSDDQYMVRTAMLLPGRSGREVRILQALYPLGKRLAPLTASVEDTVTRYAELAFLRDPLKSSFVLTLSLVVLISLLLAIYGAFFFARRLTAPIQSLAAGTRAVARGDFDTRLPAGERDEIGFLVDSFNDMISQLGAARADARRNEAQVENERASLEAILGRLSSGVVALEHDLSIRAANATAAEVLQTDFTGREGCLLDDLAVGNTALEQFVDVFRRHIDADVTEWKEQVALNIDGERRVLVCACSALPGSYSRRSGYVVVFDDITDLLRVQRDAAWGEVARRLAHEIKNPLTPIKLSAERLRHKLLDVVSPAQAETLDRATQTIIRQVEAMRDMVNAFSEYARAPEMNLVELDINRLITQVAELYPAYHGQPYLTLELDESLPLVRLDAVRMRQILHNLIRNALEALEETADAQLNLRTSLNTAKAQPRLEITVTDNGPGFPEEYREKIFEPYVTTKAKGTGLGLAIVRKLIEEHGGKITLSSEPGAGAAIRIFLPLDDLERGEPPASEP